MRFMLDILKYRIYDCELEDSNHVMFQQKVISKDELRLNYDEGIFLKKVNNDYSFNCKAM